MVSAISKIAPYSNFPRTFPLAMLLGIWFFGPLAIAVGGIPNGGTFLTLENMPQFFYLWAIFPFSTFVMSTYSGSLGGVILVTLTLLITASVKASNKSSNSDAASSAGS